MVTRGAVLSACCDQVGALHAVLRVLQRVEVAGGERGDRLGADHHPGVLDDQEHLPDALVHVAQQPALGRDAVLAEGQLAGVGDLEAHLVLDVGGEDAVALAQLAGLGVEVELRHDEQRQALGARAADALDADRAGQHVVDDVVGQVVLAAGDEALDALDVPGAVRLRDRPGAAGADVRAGVRLGEHHRRAPLLLDEELGPLLLLARCPRRAACARRTGRRRTSRSGRWRRAPARRATTTGRAGRWCRRAPAGRSSRQNSDVHERLVRLLERLRQRRGVRGRVEDRRVAVAVGVAGGQVLAGEPVDLGEDAAGGVGVEIGVRLLAERPVRAEDLEQVELEVPQVALVVAHARWPRFRTGVTDQ